MKIGVISVFFAFIVGVGLGMMSAYYKDDGIGFNETEKHQPHSLGLLGMRERAHSLKGALTISSEPGAGTKIQLTTPFVIVS